MIIMYALKMEVLYSSEISENFPTISRRQDLRRNTRKLYIELRDNLKSYIVLLNFMLSTEYPVQGQLQN